MDQDLNKILGIGSPPEVPSSPDLSVAAEKLGGWLWLPAIGIVLSCIVTVVDIIVCLGYASRLPSRYSGVFALGLMADFVLLALIIYAAFRFFGRRRNAPAIMIALFITAIAINGLLLLISAAAEAEPFMVEYGKGLVKGIIGSAIWIPYFCVSKRVKKTFLIP